MNVNNPAVLFRIGPDAVLSEKERETGRKECMGGGENTEGFLLDTGQKQDEGDLFQ